VNVDVRPAELPQVLPHLAGLRSAETGELEGCALFLVLAGDCEIGAYALKIAGRVGWVIAGAGALPGADLTADLMPAIEHQLRLSGCSEIMLRTQRAGLVKKLDAAGWLLDSTILRKSLC
jgi:hypothetical protein